MDTSWTNYKCKTTYWFNRLLQRNDAHLQMVAMKKASCLNKM